MKRKFFVATLAIGIMSTSVSILAFAQNNNEVVLSAEVAMMDSNIDEAKQSIAAYIQEDMQKYDTGASATTALDFSDSVINPEMSSFKEYVEQKKILE